MRPSFFVYLTVFGFKHAMRDRLRAASCPSEMIDQIGGWSKRSVGESYGEGFEVGQLHAHLKDII